MTDKLCDHQLSSHDLDDEGNLVCPWCEEVQALKQQIEALQECVGKTNLILEPGHHTFPDLIMKRPIGVMYVSQGASVGYECKRPCCQMPTVTAIPPTEESA